MKLLRGTKKIRVRLMVGFAAAFLGMALFGVLSYQYFSRMEHRLLFLSQSDSMVNQVLEARRYEKNYFLYHHEKDFEQALAYLGQYQALLNAGQQHLGREPWRNLSGLVEEYRRRLGRVHQLLAGGGQNAQGPALNEAVASLRQAGKELIDRSETIARQERQGLSNLLREYSPLLVGFLVVLAAIGVVLAYVLIARLVKPLQTIEEATGVVAQGEYQTIPWAGAKDEIGSLVQGFNRMVGQLRHNNEQMVQTEKLTALGTLTSGVAHELNNPLNNISTSCQILLEELGQEASPYHRELLAAIDQQVSKARDIVGSLLEFARQREFELNPEDLREVVEEARKLIRGEIPAGVEVRLEVPGGITLEMDKAHMVQALLNLVMNAIQAMGERGVVTIRGRRDQAQGQVLLEVEDTGPGIPPEALSRIFDPFFTTKDVGRGTGLGLSITYGIVERHQGHISAESQPGKGARFRLTLPLDAEGS
ncbi:MAG: HAMP domain-containing protein [Desulfarculaceae bacterium]|nr:HAMP domain-containing protein [Desulfarculaceae bacterium]MCF8072854.1 HAMP domain-containing protein [Desulfarculaceae bacterium]MCF8101022.1 HAMP domain-containing protein [Desulfarculaceae bacterium]MCF8115591.1 HAMP domain-containing protein [Desulfarculaceae bacterium]